MKVFNHPEYKNFKRGNIVNRVLSRMKMWWYSQKNPLYKLPKSSPTTRLWDFFFFFIISLFILVYMVEHNFLNLFGAMPDVQELQNPKIEQSSELYSADGVLIGKYYYENRTPVAYKELSPQLIQALIATEDERFYNHSGIDLKAIFSIFYYSMKGDNRGGSTISQQLAKNLFKTRRKESEGYLYNLSLTRTPVVKIKEWIMAVKLERAFTKEEILTLYLNTVDFGSNAYGIKTAAKTFFNTTPDQLNTEQAALLIGILKATTSYSPILHPENSIERRNVVLGQMVKNDYLNQEEYNELIKTPLKLDYQIEKHVDGASSYFKWVMNKFLTDWCKANGYDLYSDGLKIYTTIDHRLQQLAEESVDEQMKKLQKKFEEHWRGRNPWVDDQDNEIPGFLESVAKRTNAYKSLQSRFPDNPDSINYYLRLPKKMTVFTWDGDKDTTLSTMDSLRYYKHFLHAGLVTIDPFTGHVKAWVGGIDFKYFQYDHVRQAKRQPGSTFKPFVYAAAIDHAGYSPCDSIIDQRVTVRYEEDGEEKVWSPRNADWVHSGRYMTLRHAMGRSINTVTSQLTQKITPDVVVKYAQRLGIRSPLKAIPSIGLGPSEVSLYELTSAYSAFLNEGVRTSPIFISRIEDRHGNIIHQFAPQQKKALSKESAWLMMHMLKGTIEEPGGTSQNLWSFNIFRKNELAGKTGTTSNHSDGWFIGISTGLITGVWVGGEDRSIHFRSSALGEGSKTALPIYGRYMEKVYADETLEIKPGYFPKPKVKITKRYYCPTKWSPKKDTTELNADYITLDSLDLDIKDPLDTISENDL